MANRKSHASCNTYLGKQTVTSFLDDRVADTCIWPLTRQQVATCNKMSRFLHLNRSRSTMSSMLFSWQKTSARCWPTTGWLTSATVSGRPIPQSFNNCLQAIKHVIVVHSGKVELLYCYWIANYLIVVNSCSAELFKCWLLYYCQVTIYYIKATASGVTGQTNDLQSCKL